MDIEIQCFFSCRRHISRLLYNFTRCNSWVVFFSLLFLIACSRPPRSQAEFALGTVCVINLYENGNNKLYSRIFSRIREIDRVMSTFPGEFEELLNDNTIIDPNAGKDSAVSTLVSGVLAINRQAGVEPVKIRDDLLEVIAAALRYAEISGGAFDPTIGPLVKLWGIGTETQRIPSKDEIAAALELVNWRDLVIDREAGTAFLRRKGMEIDLGAIAKGYAADEAARIAKEGKAKHGIIDLGGNILAIGWRNEKKYIHWRIGVQNPFGERGDYLGVLAVHDTSVVTSGVYERNFENGGKRYHHILSTATGYPAENGLLSVTIVTKRSIEADALSTTVFALGFERGKNLIDSIPDAEAVFVFEDRSVKITEGLSGIFTLSNDEFKLF
jgi:thiamine biosynthesis lipoprotein